MPEIQKPITLGDVLEEELYDSRTPRDEVEAELAAAGLTPRTLIQTDDGLKGWIRGWTYDGFWQPAIEVALFEPNEPNPRRYDWYYPDQLIPVWSKP